MTTRPLPRVGAALPIAALTTYRDWLLDGQRDLEIQDAFNPDVLDGDWQPLVKQARAALDGHTGRRGIHGPFEGLTVLSRDPKVRDLARSRLLQALDFGAEVGATHMVVHSPFKFFGRQWLPHSPAYDRATQFGYIHDTLDPVVERAAKLNCAVVIEDIEDKNPDPLMALIDSFNSPFVRSSIDVGHAYIEHQFGGPSPDAWVRAAGSRLEHLHLQDTDGQVDRHWGPGDGAINWYALFEALAALPQQPRLIIEVKDKGMIKRGAEFLARQGFAR